MERPFADPQRRDADPLATAEPWSDRDDRAGIDTVLCDLDGVVWLAHEPIDGSVEALAALRTAGFRVLFVTNNSFATRREHEIALERIGIDAAGNVVSSSMAAATLVAPNERVLVAGGPGVAEALHDRGAEVVLNTADPIDGPVDAVVVGMHRDFDYQRLAVASDAVRRGARLIGTNADSTYPTPGGLLPGGGAILASIAVASGVEPEVAGKPHQPMADLVMSMLVDDAATASASAFVGSLAGRTVMVGDRLETDGRFARRIGCRFALVRSGVTAAHAAVGSSPGTPISIDIDVPDLAAVATHLLRSTATQE